MVSHRCFGAEKKTVTLCCEIQGVSQRPELVQAMPVTSGSPATTARPARTQAGPYSRPSPKITPSARLAMRPS